MWEAVLLSITPSYAQVKLKEGTRTGKLLDEFKRNIDRPLAAILTLNTIAHTVGAIGVGEQAVHIWKDAHPAITGILVPVGMTLAILIFSEIIPKTLGAIHWQKLAPFTVYSLNILQLVLTPAIWMCQLFTRALAKDEKGSIYSRADFVAMAEIGAEEGVFQPHEQSVIKNLMRFNTITARAVMTPRVVVLAADEEKSINEFYKEQSGLTFSRVPLYKEHKDQITGYFLKDQLLEELVNQNGDKPLSEIARPILRVEEQDRLPTILPTMIEKREHIALVNDAYGGMSGLVTMEDIIETLLGTEIMDELDSAADMQQAAKKRWSKRAKKFGLQFKDGKK